MLSALVAMGLLKALYKCSYQIQNISLSLISDCTQRYKKFLVWHYHILNMYPIEWNISE